MIVQCNRGHLVLECLLGDVVAFSLCCRRHAENGADLLYVPMSEEMIAAVLKGIEDE